ncbi:tigger transposable element-derived protein [Elysia marginata]|uniref:Tigger transposable element-derived protein n=1 Tax=Elysia marginata TaxID=1093978 RepID=A0AAV4EDH0_9GAST|nr:tigger transposable element-derived protein [Elysia marginata]
MSGGWLDRFKLRHGIVMKAVSGEAASAKRVDTTAWEAELQDILKKFEPRDIYNADETGLFYKCLPNKSLAFQGETCTGQKVPKDRISLLCAANLAGEKLPLLAIGKYEKPRCFKNIRTLPVTYRSNMKAWMTGKLFEEWVQKLDRQFVLQGRSIALIIDNCSAHPPISDLRAIEIFFLPPNTTSLLQPCDQGIIETYKTLYRKRVLRRFIDSYEETGSTTSHFKMNLLDTLIIAAASWNDIESTTIQKCFKHAGFVKRNPVDSEAGSAQAPFSPDPVTTVSDTSAQQNLSDFTNLFERFSNLTGATDLSVDISTLTSQRQQQRNCLYQK